MKDRCSEGDQTEEDFVSQLSKAGTILVSPDDQTARREMNFFLDIGQWCDCHLAGSSGCTLGFDSLTHLFIKLAGQLL
jgi:hypothetical protein